MYYDNDRFQPIVTEIREERGPHCSLLGCKRVSSFTWVEQIDQYGRTESSGMCKVHMSSCVGATHGSAFSPEAETQFKALR